MYMEFNEKLKNLRTERKLTQSDLGKLLCVSKMAVSHWEKGNSEPSISQLKYLAQYFDVSVDDLVGSYKENA